MNEIVEHWDTERYGELTGENMTAVLKRNGCSVSKYIYPAGMYFSRHSHATDKIDGVLSGKLLITMNGEGYTLGPGDMIRIPAGVEHEAEVIGGLPVVSLDGVIF